MADVRHEKQLVRIKALITDGTDVPWFQNDPTQLVQGVLFLGTHVLGYHCETGYHDELVAWHMGCAVHPKDVRKPWWQRRWVWRDRDNAGERINSTVLAPRGTGKTIWSSVLAIWYAIRYRNIRILITSKTEKAALRLSETLRNILADNRDLSAMFGSLRGNRWDAKGFNIAGRTRVEGAPTFSVIGSGGQVASAHFEVIMADDICTLENSRTELQRENLLEWFWNSLYPTCRPRTDVVGLGCGRIHGSGTRYNPKDFHWSMQKVDEWGESYRKFPAMAPASSWKRKQAPDGAEAWDPTNWQALVEDFLPVKELLHMRGVMPRLAFDAQYMVECDELVGGVFDADGVQWVDHDPSMDRLLSACGVDIAVKKAEDADRTALVHVKLDTKYEDPVTGQRGRILVWDAQLDHMSLSDKVQAVLGEYRANKPGTIVVEKVAAQALFLEQPQFSGLPMVPVVPTVDKLARASNLRAWWETRRIFFVDRKDVRRDSRNKVLQDVIYELLGFQGDRDADHDDAVDALAYAVDNVVTRWAAPAMVAKDEPESGSDPLGLRSSRRSPFQERKRR